MVCTTNYTCVQTWYVAADLDVIAEIGGPSAPDLNVTCIPNTGTIQFQVRDEDVDPGPASWFTPADASYTVTVSNVVRMPRANMPEMRVLATGDATFAIAGALV